MHLTSICHIPDDILYLQLYNKVIYYIIVCVDMNYNDDKIKKSLPIIQIKKSTTVDWLWADFAARSGDSHIMKQWITHQEGQGKPDFRLEVVKYFRDTLSRHVGEAVTIQYRGNTLNSKAGYNRSGLSRLVLPEKD